MGFEELLSKSWREYKANFNTIWKIFVFFMLIPSIIISIILLSSGIFIYDYYSLSSVFVLIVVLSLASLVLYLISILAYVYLSLYSVGKKMALGKAIRGGMKYFWSYVGLGILLVVLLVPLFILLIIPGIIFSVFWAFSGYVIMRENTGVWESMKRSKIIVKGNWWKVFGYAILIAIFVTIISIPFEIPQFIYSLVTDIPSTSDAAMFGIEFGEGVWLLIVQTISLMSELITTPLAILFFKNFYLELRAKKTHSSKKVSARKKKSR